MVVDVYQCPECELRFVTPSELEQHIAVDHPEFHAEWKSVDDPLLKAHHRYRSRNAPRDR